MAPNQKLRINTIAKDFEMKGKDVVDFLTSHGVAGKTSTGTVTEGEFSLLIDRLTKENQTKDIKGYMAGTSDIAHRKPLAVKESGEPAKTAPAQTTEKEPAKDTVVNGKRPEDKPAQTTPASSTPASSTPASSTPASSTPAPSSPVQAKPAQAKPAQATPVQAKAEQGKAAQPPVQTKNAQPSPTPSKPFQPASQARPFQPATSQQRPSQPFAKNMPERNASKSPDRFARPKFNTPDGAKAQGQKPAKPVSQERSSKPQTTFIPGRPQAPVPKSGVVNVESKSVRGGRVVDIKAASVDLSKYDERLESFVPESARRNNTASSFQKLKKQQNRNPYAARRDRGNDKLSRLKRPEVKKQQLSVTIPDEIAVSELASKLKLTAGKVIGKLMTMGVMATVNQVIDYDTAYLVADEFGASVTKEVVVTIEDKLFNEEVNDNDEGMIERSPVVCVMGHVDHGKTSLLDAIRNTHVTAGEAGGITQHIGAYRVNVNGKYITFLDTPGHAAFTAMRARGAKSTDIAILVVAADDGIMPQTVEAINHAKAAGISVIVAINKMDKPSANADRVKQELTKYDLVPEEWGGDVICVPVSALTKKGIPELLESVLLVAEVAELKANPNRRAKGLIIEARLDKGRGPVATVLVQNGTLRDGDTVIAGTSVGRIRAMRNDKGENVREAGPSVPVEITGLDEVPDAGDEFNAVEDDKMARELAEQRRTKQKEASFKANSNVNLDDLFSQIQSGVKDLNIVIKADVMGSVEAVKTAVLKLSNDEIRVNVIHAAVGAVTENDVVLAAASNAIIIEFNVRPDKNALDSAKEQNVDIRSYRVIYECTEELEAAIKGMLKPIYREVVLGHAEVRQTIHVPGVGTIAGSYVQDGKVTRASLIRVLRDGKVIFEDKISSLKRFKDDAKEVASGYECGIGLERFNDIKELDILEAYVMEQIER